MRKGHYLIVDTYNATDNYPREFFEDFASNNGIDNTDENYNDWAYQQAQYDLDDFRTAIKYGELADYPVVVEGTLGLWWGKPEIEQKMFSNMLEAMSVCLSSAIDIVIRKKGHRIEMDAMHHDGTNHFVATFLNPCGETRYNRNGYVSTNNMKNVKKLPDFIC